MITKLSRTLEIRNPSREEERAKKLCSYITNNQQSAPPPLLLPYLLLPFFLAMMNKVMVDLSQISGSGLSYTRYLADQMVNIPPLALDILASLSLT
jgi:hypothetical protein